MNRRNFIKNSCIACLTGISASSLIQSCATSHVKGDIIQSDIVVPLKSFEMTKGQKTEFKKYVVVQNELLQFPICVFRHDEKNYKALLMKCSHQGAELQIFGSKLQCPAHGSEFDSNGNALNAPATQPLREFPISLDNQFLKISLK